MTEKVSWLEIVIQLNKLTQEGVVKWNKVEPPVFHPSEEEKRAEVAYSTEYKGRKIRIYELHYKRSPGFFVGGLREWDSRVVVELVDSLGRTDWEFPETNADVDLLESVRYQSGGVKDFVDNFFGSEKGESEK